MAWVQEVWFLYLLWAALALSVLIVFANKTMSERKEKRIKGNLRSMAEVDPGSGEYVVRPPPPGKLSNALLVTWLIMLILTFVTALLLSEDPPLNDVVRYSGMILIAGFVIFSSRVGIVRFHVSDSGIRAVPLIGKPRSVPWTEIDSVDASALPRAFVLKTGKKKILIPLSFIGLNSLSSHIVRHVPADRRKGAYALLAESLGYELLPDGITI